MHELGAPPHRQDDSAKVSGVPGISIDERNRRLQNFRRGAIVLNQTNFSNVRKITLQAGKTVAGCPAKAINRLIRIADDEKTFASPVPCVYQIVLHCVDVLEFIYQQIVKALATDGIQLKPLGQQVVKVQHAPLSEAGCQYAVYSASSNSAVFKGSAVFYTAKRPEAGCSGAPSAFRMLCQNISRNGKRFASAD